MMERKWDDLQKQSSKTVASSILGCGFDMRQWWSVAVLLVLYCVSTTSAFSFGQVKTKTGRVSFLQNPQISSSPSKVRVLRQSTTPSGDVALNPEAKNGYDPLSGIADNEVDYVGNEACLTAIESRIDDDSADELSYLKFRATTYHLSQAALVGLLTGLYVAVFKLSIEAVKKASYGHSILAAHPPLRAALPALGGAAVGLMLLLGSFPPGLTGTIKQVDDDTRGVIYGLSQRLLGQLSFLRKAASAVFTLGTGCSLGPEGPCVEIGMNAARACMNITPGEQKFGPPNWNRLLLSCGAAAGVAAGFNAPVAGVFFALEIVQGIVNRIENGAEEDDIRQAGQTSLLSATSSITPILLASVISALVGRKLLGDHLVITLKEYSLKTPLIEMPLYLLLGILSGFVATSFSGMAKLSKSFFSGKVGGQRVRKMMASIPNVAKPCLGGLLCGLIALKFPQILFFGYGALDPIMSNNSLPTMQLLTLLVVKTVATGICAGSGLVGGTFAPSLFLGAMTGASFHNILSGLSGVLALPLLHLADLPAYAMVGAASVLAALFRAPLTATLLLFEITRDYDVILPLMASAGVASVIGDILDAKLKRAKLRKRRRDQDSVSWGDLATPSSVVAK